MDLAPQGVGKGGQYVVRHCVVRLETQHDAQARRGHGPVAASREADADDMADVMIASQTLTSLGRPRPQRDAHPVGAQCGRDERLCVLKRMERTGDPQVAFGRQSGLKLHFGPADVFEDRVTSHMVRAERLVP